MSESGPDFDVSAIQEKWLPVWDEFIGEFSPDVQWLISHGYGRALYFKDCHVGQAIRNAARLESLDTCAAVQGIAFAYAMLNHAELYRVLEVGSDLKDQELATAFRNGLIYALAFWEWAFAGFLDGLSPRSDRQVELIAQARELIAVSRQLGRLTVFGAAKVNPTSRRGCSPSLTRPLVLK